MLVQDKALNDFTKSIKDRKLRQELSAIVTQKLLYKVYCGSKSCKKKLIVQIYERNGQEVPEEQVTYEIRSRRRFDNEWGFKCSKCGNDSIMAKEEKGHLPVGPSQDHPSLTPTPQDLQQIAEKLQNHKPYEEVKGKKNVDGFIIERVA